MKTPNQTIQAGAAARRRSRRSQSGGILVQTVIVLAGLVALMATVAADERAYLQASEQKLLERRCDIAAKAAVARALAAVSSANTNVVMLTDDWGVLGKNGDSLFDLGNGSTFRVQVVDNNSLVDVNLATQQQFQSLPVSTEQIDCLLDWRSTGTTPRTDGAKDEYYTDLPTPYNTKLGILTTLDELLLVKNWTAYDLYTPGVTAQSSSSSVSTTSASVIQANLQDTNGNPLPLIALLTVDSGMPNKTASGGNRTNLGTGRLNANTFERWGVSAQNAAVLAAGGPYTTLQSILSKGGVNTSVAQQILNNATVSSATRLQGKINLNTATLPVLETVPNMTQDIATAIITQQQGTGFTSLGSLTSITGLTGNKLAQVADSFGVGSDTFIVRAYGQCGGTGAAYEVEIGVRNSVTRVLNWKRLPGTAVPAYWNWDADTTETVDATSLQTGTSTTSSGGTTGTTGGTQ